MASAGERTALLKYQCLKADKWSHYPATQDVNMDCNSIKNILSETFCDGTYIGPGGSFDISSGERIVIKSTDSIGISTVGAIDISSANNIITVIADDQLNLTSTRGIVNINAPQNEILINAGSGGMYLEADTMNITARTSDATISSGNNINLNGVGVNINASSGAGSIKLGGLASYDPEYASLILADVNNLDQCLTNNAYVPMTVYERNLSFKIDPRPSVAYDTNAFIGPFKWRYSGQYGAGGLNAESRYCGALRFQVDVNISGTDWTAPDTIVWWVELNDFTNGKVYKARDFGDDSDRYGYITTSQINPSIAFSICHSVSFSSIFDLEFTSPPIPNDNDDCSFVVYGWGNTSTTCNKANVSVTIRPLRTLQ